MVAEAPGWASPGSLTFSECSPAVGVLVILPSGATLAPWVVSGADGDPSLRAFGFSFGIVALTPASAGLG